MKKQSEDDGTLGCLAAVIMGLIAMPILGIYLISKEDEGMKVVGVLLTIIGVVLWIYVFSKM